MLRGAARRADHQLHAEGRAQDHPARARTRDQPANCENVPDIRYWFLDENGLRAISLVVTGADSNIVGNVASELATQMKRIPIIANVISETSLDRPELRIRPRAELAARLGVSTESLSRDHPRRHHRRRRPGAGEIRRRRPAGADPRPARGQRARRPADAGAIAGAARPARRTRRRAAVGGRRHPARSGPDQHQPLRPRTAGDRRRRPRRHRRARRRHQEDLRPAGHEEPAEGRQGQPVGRRRKPERIVGRFCHRDHRRPDDGLCGAGAAVRHLPAADHHPVLAAALDRRRDRGAAADRQAAHDAGVDRHPDADGHRHQERHHAGGVRGRSRSAKARSATRRSSTPA